MEPQLLEELVEMIKNITPLLWETALRQVNSQIASSIVSGLVFLFVSIVNCLVSIHAYKTIKAHEGEYLEGRDNYNLAVIVFAILSFFCTIVSLSYLEFVIQAMYNPNYYAIKVLMGLVK